MMLKLVDSGIVYTKTKISTIVDVCKMLYFCRVYTKTKISTIVDIRSIHDYA